MAADIGGWTVAFTVQSKHQYVKAPALLRSIWQHCCAYCTYIYMCVYMRDIYVYIYICIYMSAAILGEVTAAVTATAINSIAVQAVTATAVSSIGVPAGATEAAASATMAAPTATASVSRAAAVRAVRAALYLQALDHCRSCEPLRHDAGKSICLSTVHSSHAELHQGSSVTAAGEVGPRAAAAAGCGVRTVVWQHS